MEELFFRGFLYPVLDRLFGVATAILGIDRRIGVAAAVLRVKEQPGKPLIESLVQDLGERELLSHPNFQQAREVLLQGREAPGRQ